MNKFLFIAGPAHGLSIETSRVTGMHTFENPDPACDPERRNTLYTRRQMRTTSGTLNFYAPVHMSEWEALFWMFDTKHTIMLPENPYARLQVLMHATAKLAREHKIELKSAGVQVEAAPENGNDQV